MATVHIDDEEVLANLRKIDQSTLDKACLECLQKACLRIVRDAKQKCPAGTGELRNSIDFQLDESTISGYVGSNANHAPYVHQGTGIYAKDGNGRKNVPWVYKDKKTGKFYRTSGIHPTPFLQDAVDADKRLIIEDFRNLINNLGVHK